jgi:hypothetical protein
MSPEEFFMYLTIGLIIVAPVTVRIYRYLNARRVQRMFRQEAGKRAPQHPASGPAGRG